MKVEELRIGNYFIGYDKLEHQWSIPDFTLVGEGVYIDEIIQSFIPLTEEWLLKFGFIKEECFFYLNGVCIENDFTLEGFGYVNLKYVHQLQNIYFALTGEELKTK